MIFIGYNLYVAKLIIATEKLQGRKSFTEIPTIECYLLNLGFNL